MVVGSRVHRPHGMGRPTEGCKPTCGVKQGLNSDLNNETTHARKAVACHTCLSPMHHCMHGGLNHACIAFTNAVCAAYDTQRMYACMRGHGGGEADTQSAIAPHPSDRTFVARTHTQCMRTIEHPTAAHAPLDCRHSHGSCHLLCTFTPCETVSNDRHQGQRPSWVARAETCGTTSLVAKPSHCAEETTRGGKRRACLNLN
jgi:hypothetical protein